MPRCSWVTNDPYYIDYHDHEWGIPQRKAFSLFEMLCLEGQQSGLSWITVLKKRENYRQAFHHFNPHLIAAMSDEEIEQQRQNSGLIRHRGKLTAIRTNARAFLAMADQGENFSQFLWSFVDNMPHLNHFVHAQEVPSHSAVSERMSGALKKRGFKFVGPVTCYAFMQACGMINDHTVDCFCHPAYKATKNHKT